ncbi:Gfo/Idh/MocA family oxidoreductase [Anaerocolumna sp. AGMB13020]|uniref:Gfo/Idh/MocA family protein n=1 Tax=Anaerocolumna sp. AGMB13020 TaxID=3081750 RepID=UPI0029546BDB|nr:Gfo/Idh/MocA family oxidoreductase [Anaerocolumna sp. AGMB13020]WOO36091.1 Gfo/Idh/MocA family oxidoreductase [Anaerocolumna sp. AGMB13020]
MVTVMAEIRKAAIIGCGNIAQVHAACIAGQPGISLAGVADTCLERAVSLGEKYGAEAYYTMEELLDRVKPEIVHICTPHYLHVPMAAEALRQGRQVFMEKPPVINQEQYTILKDAVKSSKGKLGLCFQNRYNPGTLAAMRLFALGIPGRVKGGRAIVSWCREREYYTESDWRGNRKTEGGGALINQAVHSLDLLTLFLGKPVSAEAVMANHHLKNVIEVEDMMEAYIQYEEGITGCFYATTAYCTNMPPIIELHCDNMNVRVEEMKAVCTDFSGEEIKLSEMQEFKFSDETSASPEENKKKQASLGKSYWGAGHMDCITDYYSSLLSEKAVPIGLKETKDTIELMLAIYESARIGEEVIV